MARDARRSTFRHEAICEQMGLNANDVVGIDIHIRPGEAVIVEVRMIPSDATAKAIGDALKTISFEQKSDG